MFDIIQLIPYLGNTIAFSPNVPLCIGDQVVMICYVVPPPPETSFSVDTAYVSFNGIVVTFIQLNTTFQFNVIFLFRYSASIDGLGASTSRAGIRMVIASYIPSDSNTIYGCHGVFSNGTVSEALVSGMPMAQAS